MPIIRSESGIAPAKAKLIVLKEYITTSVDPSSHHYVTFTPPIGKMWQVVNMLLRKEADIGATSGTHSLILRVAGNVQMIGVSLYYAKVEWDQNMWTSATFSQSPITESGAIMALQNIVFDHNNPLIVDYYNGTNAVSGVDGKVYVSVLETSII